jgi:microcystin degradation protein MlrC
MKQRIGIGGIFHETNTAGMPTKLESFIVLREHEIVRYAHAALTYLGGLIDETNRLGMEPVPLLYAEATPSGTITAEAYIALRDELVDRVSKGDLDGLLLSLHGAGIAEGVDSIEEDLCAALRERCGVHLPIVASLDLHGNLTQRLGDLCSALFPVRFNPHTDQHETGADCAGCVADILRNAAEFVTVIETVPMLFPGVPTSEPVFQELDSLCQAFERQADVACARIMHGFPFADVPQIGTSICVVAKSESLARATAKQIAQAIWTNRERIVIDCLSAEDAVAEAIRDGRRQIVINEYADNTGGGAPGDGTYLLRALIESGAAACFSHINDPHTVKQAARAGVGETISVKLGGYSNELSGEPIVGTATVLGLNDGCYRVKSPMGTGEIIDLGLLATLRIGNVVIVVSTGRRQTLDDGPFIKAGVDVAAFPIIALKSSAHFRAYFKDHSTRIITADTPGLTPIRMSQVKHTRLTRKMWPIHRDATYHG